MGETWTEPFRPSNGTGGEIFYSDWCANCVHEQDGRECPIFSRTLVLDVDDPEYPPEWVQTCGVPWEESNPRCLAFQPIGSPLIRDHRQLELFAK